MTLTEIIARLEKATGPDRDLDQDVAVSIGWKRPTAERPYDWTKPVAANGEVTVCTTSLIPRYTASLDAALTLVPEGMVWRYYQSKLVPHIAEVCPGVERGGWIAEVDSSPAIALCIAALRARLEGASDA